MTKCEYSQPSSIRNWIECTFKETCEYKLVYGFKNYCTFHEEKKDTSQGRLEKILDQN